jgi:hypothetical protein
MWGASLLAFAPEHLDHIIISAIRAQVNFPGLGYHSKLWLTLPQGPTEGPNWRGSGLLSERYPDSETVLLLIKPVSDRPELLTSTFHVTQGGVEVSRIGWRGTWEKGRTLAVELEKAGKQWGALLFAVPEPYRVKEVRLDGRRRGVNRLAREVVGLGFSLRDRARVELDFEM